MKQLKVLDLVVNSDEKKVDSFTDKLDSSFEIKHKYDDYIYDEEWLGEVEQGIRFINNILANPNRFIVNEEEVVKVELARRITVDSIKHLSKNTNLIQDINEKSGDVKPSKILNINKEESFNTYENRFIYSVIKTIEMFVFRKKQMLNTDFKYKNEKQMQYSGATQIGQEDVGISINYNSNLNEKVDQKKIERILERIRKVELLINDLKRSELYITLSKDNVALVTSPIKKTNVILRNTNFQGVLKLWDYMQRNVEDNSKIVSDDKTINEDENLKGFIDEAFMLNYLIANTLDEDDSEKQKKNAEYLINNLIQKVVITNDNISKKELKEMVDKQFVVIKNQRLTESREIKKVFKEAIKEYKKEIQQIKL